MREVARRRISGLGEEARQALIAAAVVGRDVPLTVLTEMLPGDIDESLTLLFRRGVLRQLTDDVASFAHDQIRSAALERITGAERCRVHAAAARSLTRHKPERLADIAAHREAAGERDAAAAAYLAAGRDAGERYAHTRSEQLYRSHLRLAGDSAAIRNELGRMLQASGAHVAAEEEHLMAFALTVAQGDPKGQLDSLREAAATAIILGKMDEASERITDCLARARRLGDRAAESRVLHHMASLAKNETRLLDARELFLQVVSILRELDDLPELGLALVGLGNTSRELTDYETSEPALAEALGIARTIGDRGLEAMTIGNWALLHHDRGDMETACALLGDTLHIAEQIGERFRLCMTLGNYAALLDKLGRSDAAQAAFERGLNVARELGIQRSEGIMLGNFARLVAASGDVDAARAAFDRGLALMREVGYVGFEASMACYRATLERRLGELASAHAFIERAEALRDRAPDDRQLASSIACARAHLCLARGDEPAAQALLDAINVEVPTRAAALAADVARLQRALAAPPRARQHGECVEDVPAPLRTQINS